MKEPSAKEVEAVLKLGGQARFEYFIKRVVDTGRTWGLRQDGWALMADSDGRGVFPLWPARSYAELCAVDEWSGYESSEISLEELLSELLPKLEAQGIWPGVFPTPVVKGVVPSFEEFVAALRAEMAKYE